MKYLVLLLFFYGTSAAQQMPDYVVYLVKGEVVSQKGKANPVKVKQNQLLYATETITLKQGAEITLANKEGISVVLNTPKSYPIASLSKAKKAAMDNVSQKYLHLLFHELLDPNHDYNKFRKQNTGGVWGGVQRSGDCGNMLFPVQNLKTADLKLPFKWRKTSETGEYLLTIYDGQAKELAAIPVKDTSVSIDLTKYILKPGTYYWRVESSTSACEDETPFTMQIISKDEENNFSTSFEQKDMLLMNQLAVIERLEKENMIMVAKKNLESLVANHNDPVLAKTYSWFLLKYHLDEEAETNWNTAVKN